MTATVGKGPASSYLAGPRLLYPAQVIEPGMSSACRRGVLGRGAACRSPPPGRGRGGGAASLAAAADHGVRAEGGTRVGQRPHPDAGGWRRGPSGSRPTPRPASIRSSTSSRLSMRCTTRGAKPTREARVRTTSSSAVLREFTIQSWSAYAVRSVGPARTGGRWRARRDPTHLPHGGWHDVGAEGERGQVVVVDQGEVDVVAGEQVDRLDRLVLVDAHLDGRRGSSRGRRRPAAASGGSRWRSRRRGPTPRARRRVQVEPGGVDGGQDGHRVVGQPSPGRGEPDAAGRPARRAGYRPRGPAPRSAARPSTSSRRHRLGDGVHRARVGHSSSSTRRRRTSIRSIVHLQRNDMSSNITWTRTVGRVRLDP